MRIILLNILLLLLFATDSSSQQKYWIYFKDKIAVPDQYNDDFYDLPITAAYMDSLIQLNHQIISRSRWLNAVTIRLENNQPENLAQLDFVKKVTPVDHRVKVLSGSYRSHDMNPALWQIHADTLIQLRLHGKGVKIGIIDGGFLKADKEKSLQPLLSHKRLIAYRNFIEKDIQDPFVGTKRHNDDHGTFVWALIGGYDQDKSKHYGLATEASYYLARTDQGDKEYREEEDYWVAAIEWMHDQGVRLVNSSLGYSTGFDNPHENYTPADVDGQSSAITQAATIAAEEKNMILVISGGNDGSADFGIISIPADAQGILSVGATRRKHWSKQAYSSWGPDHLHYIKPEVACYSSYGTSFSAPVITGLIAAILQHQPNISSEKIISLVKKSGHLYPYPNNFLGYGVPDARRILHLLQGDDAIVPHKQISAQFNTIELPFQQENIILFHKKNKTQVIEQEIGESKKGVLQVQRVKNAQFTTVATPTKVVEIVWPFKN